MKQRKLLSLLIALAMTLAFLPAALAETEGVPGGATFVDGEQPLDQADNVAMVGEIGYTTLQAAIDAAIKAGGMQTVKLIANVTESVVVSKVFSLKDNNSVEVILDLAGKTLTGNGGSVITVRRYSSMNATLTLTIEDSSEEKTGKVTGGNAEYGGAIQVDSSDYRIIVNIEGGTFTGNAATYGGVVSAVKQSAPKINVKGGTFTGNTASKGGAFYVRSLAISGGTITGNTAEIGGGIYAYTGFSTDLTMIGGKVYGNTASAYGDDIVYRQNNTSGAMKLMDAAAMGVDGVDGWYVDAENDRFVTGEHMEEFENYANFKEQRTTVALKAAQALRNFVVTFEDEDGTKLGELTVVEGTVLTNDMIGAAGIVLPEKPDYTSMWEYDGSPITADTTIKVKYVHDTYVVTVQDENGNVIGEMTLETGTEPTIALIRANGIPAPDHIGYSLSLAFLPNNVVRLVYTDLGTADTGSGIQIPGGTVAPNEPVVVPAPPQTGAAASLVPYALLALAVAMFTVNRKRRSC